MNVSNLEDWRVGVDSKMRLHVQYVDSRGWLVTAQQTPPQALIELIQSIVGEVKDNDVRSLDGKERLEVMKVFFGA